jgi:hypothetical protein
MWFHLLFFTHVASAMGIVAALGIETLVLIRASGARTLDAARMALSDVRYAQRVGAVSLLLTVASGITLATVYWKWRGAWIGAGFFTVIAIAVVGATLTGRTMAAINRALAASAGARLTARLGARLTLSYSLRLALLLGVVWLMTTKPDGGATAAASVLVAAALGLLGWMATRRRVRLLGFDGGEAIAWH